MQQIKMIGLDLDGTLLNTKKELTENTRRVLREAIDAGILVLMATGRQLLPMESAKKALRIFEKYDTLSEIYFDGQGYADAAKLDNVGKYHHDPNMWNYVRTTRIAVPDIQDVITKENRSMDVALGEMLGIPKESIMACGDGDNDVHLLREVGFGVAMANAQPQVKEAADYITASNDEDGVARAIEEFALHR